MFGSKAARIEELEEELRDVRFGRSMDKADQIIANMKIKNQQSRIEKLEASNRSARASLLSADRRIHLFAQERDEVMVANTELYEEGVKAQTEILELKADIAEQGRVNRQHAAEIGDARENAAMWKHRHDVQVNAREAHKATNHCTPASNRSLLNFFLDTDSVKSDQESEPEPSRIFEEQLAKRDKTIKRLKAKVKKLTSDNKAMAAEVLHNRNSM